MNLEIDYLPFDLLRVCGYDFRVCSRVGYMLAVDLYRPASKRIHPVEAIMESLGMNQFDEDSPLMGPLYLPVRFAGNIGWNRIFIINRCSFSSPEALIGIRNARGRSMVRDSGLKVIKGLRETGLFYTDWILYRLDPASTDDMTSMISLRVEKNFTIEFAHFPKDEVPEILFRWIDS